MNIVLSIGLLMGSVSLQAWQFSDITQTKWFTRHESSVSQEFIKVDGPCALTVTQENGLVKVKGWNKESISLKITKKGSPEQLHNTEVIIDKNKLPQELSCVVSVKDPQKTVAEIAISAHVPHKTDVTVTSHKGDIRTRHLNQTQSLYADNGNIEIILDKFSVESSLFVHNKWGHITLETPKKIQAQLSASTLRGSITSDIFITVQPLTTLLDKGYWQRVKRDVQGFLGDGGAPITLEAENGDIRILAKK